MKHQKWQCKSCPNVIRNSRVQCGEPTIKGTRIQAWVLSGMHAAGDPVPMLAHLYGISEAAIWDAIRFEKLPRRKKKWIKFSYPES